MKKFIISLFAFMLTIYVSGAVYNIGNHEIHYDNGIYFKIYQSDTFRIDTTTFIIKYVEGTDGSAISTIENTHSLIRDYEFITGYISYNYTSGLDYRNMCMNLTSEQDIEVLELNYEVKPTCDPLTPDDIEDFLENQWYLDRIQATRAWNITTGNESVVVGIIDSGFDWEHDDLGPGNDTYESSYLNPYEDIWSTWNDPCSGDKEITGTGILDDWKGISKHEVDCQGYPQMENDSREYDEIVLQNTYGIEEGTRLWRHGTHIAGIIGAKTNNTTGIAGIAGGWGDKGVSLLYLNHGLLDDLNGITANVAECIHYCVLHGGQSNEVVNIIQMALFTYPSDDMKAMLSLASDQGIFLVASSGNGGGNSISFPANHNTVFAVGATGKDDLRRSYSNHGTDLDISAPGEAIIGIEPDNGITEAIEGKTSAASAMVSGTVGLMLSVNPDLTNEDIAKILHESADKVGNYYYYWDPARPGHSKDVGYGRLNTYKAVCKAWEYIEFDEEIESNTTWSDPKSFINPVIVYSGAKLTITSEIQFGPEAVLIIEPGAELELDGGVLTNLKCCGYDDVLWPGVEVWGKENYTQFFCEGEQHQGKITILNGGTIENAEIGVLLAARTGETYNQTGGIIQVRDNGDSENVSAYFINNKYSVMFRSYQNFVPDYQEEEPCTTSAGLTYNVSYLKNCHFEVNGDYMGGDWLKSNIYMLNVNGVDIEGCTFVHSKTETPHGHGINAWGSGFQVKAICRSHQIPCAEEDLDRNIFTNFYKGINLISSGTYTITVNDAKFYDNTYGVKLKDVNNAAILFSKFHIGQNAGGIGECEGEGKEPASWGIHMEYCTGFAIEENKFYKATGAPTGNYVGIYIAETQSTDQVYNNDFFGLSYGNYAVGKNFEPEYNFEKGLAYYCNENTGNFADFYVEPDGNPIVTSGIQSKQGNDQLVAGNKFTHSGATWHFYNGGDYLVGYYFCDYCANENPDDDKEEYITDKPKNFDNSCPSHYGGGGGGSGEGRGLVLSPEERLETEIEFATNLDNYNNVKTLYDNLKDGGNTEATIAEIETSWPSDMWELRAELLGKSPHLSMEVLKATADNTDVLPDNVIFEIMAANPDELKKEELIKYLEDKANPLPEYMINILRQVAEGTTYKTVLEQEMAHYNQVKSRAAYDIIRSNLNDSISNTTELRNWLDNIGGKRADEQIITSYIAENNYTDALGLANMMPSLYDFTGYELTEHNYYMDILNIQFQLSQEGRTVYDLENNEVNSLETIADNSSGTAGAQAQGILEFVYGNHYCNCLNVSDSTGFKSSGIINPEDFAKAYGLEIITEPNPGNEWVAFNYKLPCDNSVGEIKIIDSKGSFITTLSISGIKGQKVWDTRKLKPGIYFYTLSVGEFTQSDKIVISK